MSSEGSSRLRQFGLYKTIDSHTAEFLKLSRKRQIRRGCACAAVSTAITVTVVVVTLLIYEFGFRTDYKPTQNTLRKLSWMNVVNDSNVFDKYPMKNNGKLLALILKSLDQKRHLETIVEESNLKPSHEQTTYSFQKDVFSDAKNRKIPGYKPSRFLPNRRKDGIAKARKIIDYQRVITYLNSMSFTENTDETTQSDIYIGRNSRKNITDDIFHQDYHQASKAETKRSENNKAESKMVPAQHLSCKCPFRSNLTEILEKLHKSIQQLHPKVIEVKSNDNKTNKEHTTATGMNQQSKTYSPIKRPSVKFQNIKRATTTIFPEIKTATNAYSPISNISNNDTFGSEISIIEQHINETNTKSNLFKSHKNEETDTRYDDFVNVYIQTLHSDAKPTNNRTNENSSVSDVTVKYTQMAQEELYDFDDKLYNIAPGSIQDLNTSTGPEKINNKKNVEFNDFENYLSGLSKLENLIVNKPQTSALPAAFIEDPKMMQWDFKRFLNHEIGDPIKRVSIPTEALHENKQKKLPYQITKETPVIYKYKSGASLKENDEKFKSTPEFLVNGVDENIPLTPMMQSFLLSKKDSGLILRLDEMTTMSNKLQREDSSSEDLPFHLRFFEDEEKFISLKSHTTTPTPVLKKDEKNRGQRVHDSIQSSHEKARQKKLVNIQFDEEDEYLSTHKTDTVTPTKAAQQHNIRKDEHDASLNDTTAITKDAQRRDLDVSSLSPHTKTTTTETQKHDINIYRDASSLKLHTETTTKEVQQRDINREIDVNSLMKRRKANIKKTRKHHLNKDRDVSRLRTHTKTITTETQKYYINGDKDAWSLWREEKQRGINRGNVKNIKHSPKKSRKKAKKVPRMQLSTRKLLKPTEAPTTEHKRSKIKEIFYMTGDETPIDDFETKLSSLMYFEDAPINYTALANTFINKEDSASAETSKSMMPKTRPSNLEIRRNPELTDYYPTSWYTNDINDNNDEQSVFSLNF